jgi:hypothetical protein
MSKQIVGGGNPARPGKTITCVHELEMECHCPENGMLDRYRVEFHVDRFVACEEFLEECGKFRDLSMHQEKLTAELATRFRCKVVTFGTHCNALVRTRVEC